MARSKGPRLKNEDSTMAEPVSTQNRKKEKLLTEPARTIHGFQTRRFNCDSHSSLIFCMSQFLELKNHFGRRFSVNSVGLYGPAAKSMGWKGNCLNQ